MASSKESLKFADAPQIVVDRAVADKRIVLNPRPDHWPKEWLEKFKNDKVWQICCQLGTGFFIAPSLTDFMNTIEDGEPLAILCQDAGSKIFMVKTNTRGVLWVDTKKGEQEYGVLGQIKTEEGNGLFNWHIWASYVLAVVRLSSRVKPSSTPDPTGETFLAIVTRHGKSLPEPELIGP